MRADSVAVFAEASRALRDAGLAYALVGATSFGAYTLPRSTLDLDILVEAPARPLDLTLRGLHLVEKTKDVFFDQEAYVFEVATYVTPVEIFVATHWLTREAVARRRMMTVPGLGELPVVRADDAALLKAAVAVHPARWSAKRASDADDLRRLREADPEIDRAYLAERARRLGAPVVEMLRAAGFEV